MTKGLTETTSDRLKSFKSLKAQYEINKKSNSSFEYRNVYEAAYRIMSTVPRLLETEFLKKDVQYLVLKDPKWFFGYKPGRDAQEDDVMHHLLSNLLKPFGFRVNRVQKYGYDLEDSIRAYEIN